MSEHSILRPNGHGWWFHEFGRPTERDSVQCVHCHQHWFVQPGSGKVRGWCMNCNGPVCGPQCADCVPREQKLENMEKGRDPNFRPIVVSVPDGVPGKVAITGDKEVKDYLNAQEAMVLARRAPKKDWWNRD